MANFTKDGIPLSTQSMLNTFRRCPAQFDYAYVQRLKVRKLSAFDRPLSIGIWMHDLQEAYYKGQDWTVVHEEHCAQYDELFDEEKEALGNLPEDCLRLMRAYLWHYGANKDDPFHGWTIHGVELKVETKWPNGDLFQGKVDILVEIEDLPGLYIGDHKWKKRIPDFATRTKDIQSITYIKAARDMGIDVRGFFWNYALSKAPTIPHLLQDGTRLSRDKKLVTDYPTLYYAVKNNGLDFADYRDMLLKLKSQRYEYGKMQTSPFFRLHMVQPSDFTLRKAWLSAYHTHRRMQRYPFDRPELIELDSSGHSCGWCRFNPLCQADQFGGNSDLIRKQLFTVGDPMDYYQEKEKKFDD